MRGDSVWRLAGPGAHGPEARVLGVVVPLVVVAMVVERLLAWTGPWWTPVLAVPARWHWRSGSQWDRPCASLA